MRVLLVDTAITGPPRRRGSRWAPLGLAYLAAALREAGHEVGLHNRLSVQSGGGLSWAELDRATEGVLADAAPDLVGISGVTVSFADMLAVAEIARRVRPRARIVLGGAHASAVPVETLERVTAADCLVVGEGEERIVALAAGLDPGSLPGVAWRDSGGEVRVNPWEAPQRSLDELPPPARDLLDMRRYVGESRGTVLGSPLRCINLLSGRGCLHRCAFCSEPAYSVRGYRGQSPERTVEEAHGLLARYRTPLLVFMDEDFVADRERVVHLMELWQREGLARRVRFAVQARADGLDPELLTAMARAGCIHLELGMESGSDRVLKLMNKGCTVAQNCAAAEMVKRAGIMLQLNVVCGAPGETEDELRASLALVEAISPAAASIRSFLLFPGTAFARQLVAQGRVAPDFWDLRDREAPVAVGNYSAMDDETFEALCAEGMELARRINMASSIKGRPWWWRAARRVKRTGRALLGRGRGR